MSLRASLTCGLCLALLSTLTHAAEKRLDRTFTVQPGGKLTVDSSGSDITVRGTDSDQVVVHIVATGSQKSLDRLDLSAEASTEGVAVTTRNRQSGLGWLWSGNNQQTRISVSVPKRYRLELKTSGGDLEIEQLQGTANGRTSGGDVHVAHVNGEVRMRTSGGDIVADDIHGTTDLDTSGGSIKASVDGQIRAVTSGGNIDVGLVGANRGIDVSTSGGNILLQVPRNVAGLLDASTSGGSVVSDLPVTTVVSSSDRSSRKLNGTLNGGGELIKAHTSGGNVRLRAHE